MKFYMVWNEKRELPARKHFHKKTTLAEAERLSKENPGHIYYVLECVGLKFSAQKKIPSKNT